MADQENNILSEHTEDMTSEQREEIRQRVGDMTEEKLREFRNSFDPDRMGFSGEEG